MPENGDTMEGDIMQNDDDFELCDRLFISISDHFGDELKAEELPECPRTVLLVWHASGIIDNGGFEHLFECNTADDPGFKLTHQAFESIGSDLAASALRDALALFPNREIHSDRDARGVFYRSLPAADRARLNERFWSAGMTGNDEIKIKLAKFIREHEAEFSWWLPQQHRK